MPIPDFQTLMRPLLDIAADDHEHNAVETVRLLAVKFNLSNEEFEQRFPSGAERVFSNRVRWATTYLKQAGVLNHPRRGYFKITTVGRALLATEPERISVALLEQFPEFQAFRSRKKDPTDNDEKKRPQSAQSELEPGDFNYIRKIFGIKPDTLDLNIVDKREYLSEFEIDILLSQAEIRAVEMLEKSQELNSNIEYNRVQRGLAAFYSNLLVSVRHGLDYDAELRFRAPTVNKETYPSIFRLIVSIPGDKGFGLERENHGFGYHIHYVRVQGAKSQRANAIFTFNPNEPHVESPVLYWEPHHDKAQVKVNPAGFIERRRLSIYDVCTPFLSQVPINKFKELSKDSSIFYP